MVSTDVDIKKLLEAGAHFGHKTSRWHPKMAPYIHSKRGDIHIIDLTSTVEGLQGALQFITDITSQGKQLLLVGTKRQAKEIVKKLGEDTNMPYVTERWLGGMLTNQKTIGGRIKYLKDLETKMQSGEMGAKYNKLEIQRYQEEIDQMNFLYGGVKNLSARPGAVLVFDVLHDANAVREAKKLNLPLIAIVDTNTDPTGVDFPIPANDDATKTLQLIADYVEKAVVAGKNKYQKSEKTSEKPGNKETPSKAEKSAEES